VLLVKRAKPPQAWALPGGAVEFGETARAAAERELFEETGLRAELPAFVGFYEIIRPQAKFHFAIACHTGLWTGGEAVAASDAAAVRWIMPTDLDPLELAPDVGDAITRAAVLLSI
jgi:8-oxo-dGTP diphosphatase